MDSNTKNFFEKLAGFDFGGDEFESKPVKNKNMNIKKDLKEEKSEDAKETVVSGEAEKSLAEDFDDFEGQLTIDVYQTPNNIVIESTIAGVNQDDLDIAITPDSVTVKGERHKEEKTKKEDYLYQECFWGRFSRSIILPQEIDPDRSQASVKNGVLKIILPKLDRRKEKKLRVKFD